jgi:hypothetical protein
MIQYRVRFRNTIASDRFAVLASLWRHARGAGGNGGINKRLEEEVVSPLAGDQWDDDKKAFAEIDMLTSDFALRLVDGECEQ